MAIDIENKPFDTWWGPLNPLGDPDDDLFGAPLEWDEPTVARLEPVSRTVCRLWVAGGVAADRQGAGVAMQ